MVLAILQISRIVRVLGDWVTSVAHCQVGRYYWAMIKALVTLHSMWKVPQQ